MIRINPGTSSYTGLRVRFVDDSGLPLTGKVAADFPPLYYTLGVNGAAVPISLNNLSAITSAYISGGVKEDSGSVGVYRIDPPDLMLATADVTVYIYGDATNKHVLCPPIQVEYTKADVVRQLGSDLSNGFLEKDDDGTLHVNVTAINGDTNAIAAIMALRYVFPAYTIFTPDGTTFHVAAPSTANLSKWAGYTILWMPGSANALTASVISGASYNGPGLPNDWTITLTAGTANVVGDQFIVCDLALANVTAIASSLATQAQTDVKTAMTSQGYTTARGTKLDDLDATISSRSTYAGGAVASVTGNVGNVTGSVGSLAAQAQTDVRSALTAQGLTTTRASNLDNLDASVSSVGSLVSAVGSAVVALALKFSGITSVANWLRNAFRKSSPDATATTEINTGGGTFDPTTDSLESIKDNEGSGGGDTITSEGESVSSTDAVT